MTKSNQKILFLTRSLDYGGAERQLVVLAKCLHERGYKVAVASFYAGGPLEKDLLDAGISTFNLEKRGRWDVIPFLWRLAGLIRREKPAVFHGYITGNLMTFPMKLLFPGIKTVWGVRASDMDLTQYDWLARMSFRLSCFLSKFADVIIVNSHAGRDYHVRHGYPAHHMVVIPNGIDTEKFKHDPAMRARLRSEWGIKENEILVGLVARIDPMKDHASFLKAASMLSKERSNVRFVCVGDGPEPLKSKLSAMSQELGLSNKLLWAGARNDMQAVYSGLDILASSSCFGEGFSNVIGEAMACGVPCVVTDAGDSRLIVGQTGIVVAPRDPDLLKTGLGMMLKKKEDPSTLAEDCRKRIVENFSIQAMVDATLKTLI